MKATRKDLIRRAQDAIDRREEIIYDVASESGQMVDNVAHMRWFVKAVANAFIETTKKYAHLEFFR